MFFLGFYIRIQYCSTVTCFCCLFLSIAQWGVQIKDLDTQFVMAVMLDIVVFFFPRRSTYSLTPWCRVLLENLTGLQLVKKFPAFHGTRRFITALTSVRHLSPSRASPIQSIYPHPTSWISILMLSTHSGLGLPSGLFPSAHKNHKALKCAGIRIIHLTNQSNNTVEDWPLDTERTNTSQAYTYNVICWCVRVTFIPPRLSDSLVSYHWKRALLRQLSIAGNNQKYLGFNVKVFRF